MGPSKHINKDLRQNELSEAELLLRKEFARLFCETHNAYEACIRLGFAQPYAVDWARAFMEECVVREFIAEEQQHRASEEGLKDAKQRVMIKLWEQADYNGPGASHGARVAALTNIGKFLGMAETEEAPAGGVQGGVMIVPELTSPNDWGTMAARSQLLLKQTVKD